MPTYDYFCEKCELVIEIKHSIHDESEHYCEQCKMLMQRQIGTGYILAKGLKPTLDEIRDTDHTKKVKDPDRARKARISAFGREAVGSPPNQSNPRHIVKKGRTIGGQQKEIDRAEFIKAAAKDDRMVAEAKKALQKKP